MGNRNGLPETSVSGVGDDHQARMRIIDFHLCAVAAMWLEMLGGAE